MKALAVLGLSFTVACGGPTPTVVSRPNNLVFPAAAKDTPTTIGSEPLLPAEVPLGPYVPALTSSVRAPNFARGQVGDSVHLLEDGSIAVLSFGRRVLVTGKTARIIDRGINPDYVQFIELPTNVGGGFIVASDRIVQYLSRFEAEPVTLQVQGAPNFFQSVRAMFGPHAVLFVDAARNAADEDRSENYTYVSLTTGQKLPFTLLDVSMMAATLDGRTAVLMDGGDLHFSPQPGQPFRRLDLPWIRQLLLEENEIQATDANGPFVLDPSLPRDQMQPARRSGSMKGATSPRNSVGAQVVQTHNVRQSRRLEQGVNLVLNGSEEISLVDAFGVGTGQSIFVSGKAPSAPTMVQRECSFVAEVGPLLVACNGTREGGQSTLSLHLLDPKSRTLKLEKGLSFPPDQSMPKIVTGPTGLPGFQGMCDGRPSGTTVCVRTPSGTYKEIDMRTPLMQVGLFAQNMSPTGAMYFGDRRLVLSADNATVAIVGTTENGNLAIAVSDGRTRVIERRAVPKRLQTLSNTFRFSHTAYSIALVDGAIVGLLAPLSRGQVGSKAKLLKASAPKFAPRAFWFRIPMTGDVESTYFEGFVGQSDQRSLRVAADGSVLEESNDLGRSYHTVAPPPGLRIDTNNANLAAEGFCAETACMIGPWLRLQPEK
jgi:hypothetical protein